MLAHKSGGDITHQAEKMRTKYAPLLGIDQFGDGSATDELQYWNYGWWDEVTSDPKLASAALAERLLTHLPSGPAKILDVAFGQGATLHELCARYGAENVTGINIAWDQVEHARRAGISCDMRVMDAAELDFPIGSFDGILCMEAAFHFRSRASFLQKAFGVLRPGGVLVLSDFLLRGTVALDEDIFPPENVTSSVQDYERLFVEAGFAPSAVTVEITTSRQLIPFLTRMLEFSGYLPHPDPDVIRIHESHSQVAIQFVLSRLLNIAETAIVVARR